MIKNYLKVAFRNYLKNGTTSLINFLGLTVGIASSVLIFLYVNNEISYDKFHSKADRIYRILSIDKALGVSNNLVGITMPALGKTMTEELPDVENDVRIYRAGKALVNYKDQNLYTENMIYTGTSFFEVFDFKVLEGDPKTCLERPNTVLLTPQMAKRIFGEEDPIGKSFDADGSNNLEVTGIIEQAPGNSHIQFDIVASINPSPSDTNVVNYLNAWTNISMVEYALLKNPSRMNEVIVEMDSLMTRHEVRPQWRATLQPLSKAHLESKEILFDDFNKNKGNLNYVRSLGIIAIIIILIAGFNYMNLATARSAKRAHETGLRKAIGAFRKQLISQHLLEAILQTVLSFLLAMGIVELINNIFHMIDGTLFGFFLYKPSTFILMFLSAIGLGVLSGLYPAFVLSVFRPKDTLKGGVKAAKNGIWLRRSLVVLQFSMSTVMIIGASIVYKQLRYTLEKDKGFSTEQIVNIQLNGREMRNQYSTLKSELEKIPSIKAVASSGSMPGEGYGRTGIRPEGAKEDDFWIVSTVTIDENYIDLIGMEILKGENFRENMPNTEGRPVIVNESFVKLMNWKEPINKIISPGEQQYVVKGVVKDFHFTSLRHQIEPIMIRYRPGANRTISLKVQERNMKAALTSIEEIWTKLYPNAPFEYEFFDEEYSQLFVNEERFSTLLFRFTMLSIFVAMLGLFGLASFSAEQKTKEIGIRKVLGASIKQMIWMQSHEYNKLIGISVILAFPVAYFLATFWLQDFQYKIELDALPFILSASIALAISFLTVSFHSYRAATRNPANTLKYE